MKLSTYLRGLQDAQEMGSENINVTPQVPETAVMIRTSSGIKIPVQASVLASASPVFEEIVGRRRKKGRLDKPIPILGVPSDAVRAFVGFLCSQRCEAMEQTEVMDKYGMHLMVLSHVYRVKWLKDVCETELALRLTADSVVDVLQLARLCDVPKLYLQCMRLLHKEFAAAERTEAWGFLQDNDPWLELEILRFLEEEDMRRKRWRRKMEEQKAYLQLSDAMECLQHICTDGCTDVGPYKPKKGPMSCPCHATCRAIQTLIRHLASCRANRAACRQCRRVADLLRLHSSICDMDDHCNVPLCKQMKLKMQSEGKVDDRRWGVLAKKVASVQVMSCLAKRMKHCIVKKP